MSLGWPGQAPAPGYGGADRERWCAEPAKNPRRGDFARDRARLVHSAALRRLAAKTQVVGPGTDDFVRNRLTHSLEVAQIGRELGMALGCDPDVVETACLAHDLGHPPFGHNGESTLAQLSADIGGFEGNAQSLRILTRLEPKVLFEDGRPAGLNLTRASLDAATKYPWGSGEGPAGSAKFGVYPQDLPVFTWLREGAQPGRRCVEAQVMDLADDVAYSVHDVEDAVVAGFLDPAALSPDDLRGTEVIAEVAALARQWYLPDATEDELTAALARLEKMPMWLTSFDGSQAALSALKDLTSQLIGRFLTQVHAATRSTFGLGPLTRFQADVVVPREVLSEIAVLKGIAAVFVMSRADRSAGYLREQELLAELVELLVQRGEAALETPFAHSWQAASDDAGRLRVVIDQVASLTDVSARQWHARLSAVR